ncbi:polysaccharide biosynthesis/export family protein [Jannaschia ovalis]|uniref:Polysaccharide biosynthesis/export family protein n=1 Tax=Jannaschia ovalis TaxID=3038773 RepID=A0ABY8LE65_9RHOB|nr:polysaccharide biosynthesis/export family protein [Jannaschia sp. GRR-S6-38]WGH78917.1 polysaccharide biosynthesis/export family protein [Jannaschia sp. GRR-S6-38]
MLKITVGLLFLLVIATPLAAEPYRLVMGDQVIVDYDFLEEPKTTIVDLDGNIRLAELGSIAAAGRSLDEVKAAIERGMAEDGFSGVSFVSVEVAGYAPVVVTGFVERSGAYDFLPGMTVGAALALAGGVGSDSGGGPDPDVLLASAGRRVTLAAGAITDAVATITRLEAALSGAPLPLGLPPDYAELVPEERRAEIGVLLELEGARLSVERARETAQLASWESEIADYAEQARLLDARIAVKTQSLQRLETEFDDLEGLRSQGLATVARTSTLQQRLADDREELLALETAKIAARRARSLAERNRDAFLSDQRLERLDGLRRTRAELQDATRSYRVAVDELVAVGDDSAGFSVLAEVLDLRFTIRSARPDRPAAAIDRDTPVLPGDILTVEVGRAGDGGG